MSNTYKNLCSRCGTERKVVKISKEMMGESEIITTQTACPNADCQKIIDTELREQIKKKELHARKKAQKMSAMHSSSNNDVFVV